jgi:hypothetical protein
VSMRQRVETTRDCRSKVCLRFEPQECPKSPNRQGLTAAGFGGWEAEIRRASEAMRGGRESRPRLLENLRNTPKFAQRVSVQRFAARDHFRRSSSVRSWLRLLPPQCHSK